MGDHELYMETWGGLHPLEGYKSGACVGSGVSFKPGGKMFACHKRQLNGASFGEVKSLGPLSQQVWHGKGRPSKLNICIYIILVKSSVVSVSVKDEVLFSQPDEYM